jgi:hypothetical protein
MMATCPQRPRLFTQVVHTTISRHSLDDISLRRLFLVSRISDKQPITCANYGMLSITPSINAWQECS